MTVPVVAKVRFSPANQLTHEIREYGARVHEHTPAWAQFPRWWSNGGALWLESSSGSRLLTVRFDTEEIIVPSWKAGGRTEPMPSHWADLYLGSLFDRADGSALHPEKFAAAMAQDGWKGALR